MIPALTVYFPILQLHHWDLPINKYKTGALERKDGSLQACKINGPI